MSVAVSPAGSVLEQHYHRYPVSVGRDVFRSGRISRDTSDRVCAVFAEIADHLAAHAGDGYRAVATAALREARNGEQVVRRIRRATRVDLEVISGVAESRLSRAALLDPIATCPRGTVLLDLGGGSLELSQLDTGRDVSLAIGTLRMVEEEPALLQPLPTDEMERISARVSDWLAFHIRGALRRAPVIVGTGGNLDALARIIPRRRTVLPTIDASRLGWLARKITALPLGERARRFDIRPDRAELLLANVVILRAVARALGTEMIVVPGTGVRRSLLQELLESSGIEEPARALLTRMGGSIRPARRFVCLATSLFDGLRAIHGLWEPARDTLEAAAWIRPLAAGRKRELARIRAALQEANGLLVDTHARRVASSILARSLGRRAPLPRAAAPADRLAAKRLSAMLELAAILEERGVGRIRSVEVLRRPITIRVGLDRPLARARLERVGRALGHRLVVA